MVFGDDRYQPALTPANIHRQNRPDMVPILQEVQEELRKLFEITAKLEGRLGTILLRDNLEVMGSISSRSVSPAPSVSADGTGGFYLDPDSGKYLISENGDAYVELVPSARCRITNSTNTTIANNTITTLSFDTNTFDTDNMHDIATNPQRITFQTSGVYSVGGLVYWDLPAGPGGIATLEMGIVLNGTNFVVRDSRYVDDQNGTTSVKTMYPMVVGDYLEVVVRQISGAALDILATSNYSPVVWALKVSG